MKDIFKKLKTFTIENKLGTDMLQAVINMEIDYNNKGSITDKDFNIVLKCFNTFDTGMNDLDLYQQFLTLLPQYVKRENTSVNVKNNTGQVNYAGGNSTINAKHIKL
jgi:hypothetical protein